MRVVVTGVAGFIGAAVASRLLAEGHVVVGIDCFLPDLYSAEIKRERAAMLLPSPGFQLHELDLRVSSLASVLAGADVVVNLAAMPGLTPSWSDFRTYQDCNTLVVQRILQALSDHGGIHLVHGSSSSVYGARVDGDEESPLAPVSPYGVTKLAAEHLISAYRANHGVTSTVLRYFSAYGPGQRPDMAYAVICQRILEGLPVPITSDGRQTRSNTYIDDVVDATVRACAVRPDAVLNISGADEIALLDAVSILSEALGRTPDIEYVSARPGDQRSTHGTSERAAALLDWRPTTGIETGLRNQALHAAADHELSLSLASVSVSVST